MRSRGALKLLVSSLFGIKLPMYVWTLLQVVGQTLSICGLARGKVRLAYTVVGALWKPLRSRKWFLITSIDPYENIYTVVKGEKRFTLLPPSDGWCLKGRVPLQITILGCSWTPCHRTIFILTPSSEDLLHHNLWKSYPRQMYHRYVGPLSRTQVYREVFQQT